MRRTTTIILTAAGLLFPIQSASADTVPGSDLKAVSGLTAAQQAAIATYVDGGRTLKAATSTRVAFTTASSSRRASYYRGSALMWTRDNVDFGYNWSSVTWTSAFQQAGWIWPNIARNGGITKYYDTVQNDRFRALNTIGAGIPTPWGDVKLYSSDFVHRLSVYYNGAWSAWSD